MKKTNLNNIVIVLVEPQEAGNIGSCCRAMKNMGIKNLRLVNPIPILVRDTFRLCHNSEDIIFASEVYDNLKDAIADIGYVVATSRRKGKNRKPIFWISEILPKITKYSQNNKIALVFGRESKGLSNDELSLCNITVSLPSHRGFPTLNLAQSVLLVCYELFLSKYSQPPTSLNLAPQEELWDMYSHIKRTLTLLGYKNIGSRKLKNTILQALKRVFGRTKLENRDTRMIRGLCTQVETKLNSEK